MDDQGGERSAVRASLDRLNDRFARRVDDRRPVLFGFQACSCCCIWITVWVLGGCGIEQMSHWNEDDDAIFPRGRSGRIDSRGYVDVERRIAGYGLPIEDRVEGFTIFVCEEDVMRVKLGNLLGERPVEGYGGAGTGALLEGLSVGLRCGGGEEVIVCVDEICIHYHQVGSEFLAGRELYTSNRLAI